MNLRTNIITFIIAAITLTSSSVFAVSDWALQKARERVAQLQAEKDAALILAIAKQMDDEEREKIKRACEMLGYCFVSAGKGIWFVTKNAIKAAIFATTSIVKTAYYAVADPDELRDRIKTKEVEPFVGIACLSGIIVATIAQIVNNAAH